LKEKQPSKIAVSSATSGGAIITIVLEENAENDLKNMNCINGQVQLERKSDYHVNSDAFASSPLDST
jgi:hypothetical protein